MQGKKKQRQHNYTTVINSPIGKIGIALNRGHIIKIEFLSSQTSLLFPKSVVARLVVTKIKKYFCNPYYPFDLLLDTSGTLLQKKIWRAVQKISVGTAITYGELAKKLKTGPRVIGNAMRLNPLPIIIPCHRVIAVNGLGGYCGKSKRTIEIKKWLLKHEGVL